MSCARLDAAGIPHWRDRTSLAPGDAWKTKIREAIRARSLVLLACFSNQSQAKLKSYMNEELTLAAEEFRLFPPGRTWLIPVRLDDVEIPEWDLGAGRTLRDLNYVDLFGAHYVDHTADLIVAIRRVMREEHPDRPAAHAAAGVASS